MKNTNIHIQFIYLKNIAFNNVLHQQKPHLKQPLGFIETKSSYNLETTS